MKRGEIRWYKFHQTDKQRPVLIVTRNSVLEYLGAVTVAPVTTTMRNIPSEVLLTQEDGMPRECAINCDRVQTVAKGKLGTLITMVSPEKMGQVGKAICFALGM